MYNTHRGMVQPPNNNNNRLSELFEQIRREFDIHAQDRAGEHDQSSEFAVSLLHLLLSLYCCQTIRILSSQSSASNLRRLQTFGFYTSLQNCLRCVDFTNQSCNYSGHPNARDGIGKTKSLRVRTESDPNKAEVGLVASYRDQRIQLTLPC